MANEYEDMLENIYENLPEKALHKGERFEMPHFEFFVEGNKTMVRNFGNVIGRIRREPQAIVKYLSKELAVPASMEGERLVLHRKMSGNILNKKLQEFVERYVLCKECKKPDTHLQQLGHGLQQLVCEACGAKTSVS